MDSCHSHFFPRRFQCHRDLKMRRDANPTPHASVPVPKRVLKPRRSRKVELTQLDSGAPLETLLVALPVDVTYAAVACLQAK